MSGKVSALFTNGLPQLPHPPHNSHADSSNDSIKLSPYSYPDTPIISPQEDPFHLENYELE